MKQTIFILLSLFIFNQWKAQISLEAKTSSKEVSVGDVFNVSYMIVSSRNVNVDSDIDLPSFLGFQVLGQSQSNNFSNVNGVQQIQTGYTLSLRATKIGTFTLSPATVNINGKTYKSSALVIKVSDSRKKVDTYSSNTGRKMKDAFLRVEVSKKNPYINEGVVLNLKYFASNNAWLQRMQGVRPPTSFRGFSTQGVTLTDNEYKQELVNGDLYISAVVARYIVFPTQSGELIIEPFTANIIVPSQSFFDDDHMVEIYSSPIKISAKNLPLPKPKDFSGAVGEFTLNVTADKEKVKANEAVKVNVEIEGKGNLKLVKTPEIEVPNTIENYPPKSNQNIAANANGVSGYIRKENILVAQYGGEYDIKIKDFSYFDPYTNAYKNLIGKTIHLEVDGPEKPTSKDTNTIAKLTNDAKGMAHEKYENIENSIEEIVQDKKSNYIYIIALLSLVGLLSTAVFFYFKRKNKDKNSLTDVVESSPNVFEKIQKVELPKVDISAIKKELQHFKPLVDLENKDHVISKLETILRNFDTDESIFLLAQCQLEKYSPITTEENLVELFDKVEQFVAKF